MGRDGRVDELVTGGESVTCCLFLNFQIFKKAHEHCILLRPPQRACYIHPSHSPLVWLVRLQVG